MASQECYFCGNPVNPHDIQTYHEVKVWVHGPKRDGATLREETGRVAHERCIHKAKSGQAPDQEALF